MQALHREAPFALPIRVVQFGQGNFLRGFIDWQIDLLNERCGLNAGVVIVRPTLRSPAPLLDVQGGVYTTLVRGIDERGEVVKEYRKIQCVQREIDLGDAFDEYLLLAHEPDLQFVVSNTTEAGIAINDTDRYDDRPQDSFPGKLTRWLHERFRHFNGAADKGLLVLPCELIDDNGKALKAAVQHFATLWSLGDEFSCWIDQSCTFCSTLVDRIVPGYPAAEMAEIDVELGYHDQFLVAAEHFYLLLIEGPAWVGDALKLKGSGLNIQLVEDIKPYKQRKVGVLNGAHTTMVPVALLAGLSTVGEAMKDADVERFLKEALDQEIIPALPLPRTELDPFAADVLRRFRNPYIQHRLASIALNSCSKFAARVMPQILAYQRLNGRLPQRLVFALAATMHLYRGGVIDLADEPSHLAWFDAAWQLQQQGQKSWAQFAAEWLARMSLWGEDLNQVPGFAAALAESLRSIAEAGPRPALQALNKQLSLEPAVLA